jgi:hypothetical protein
LENSGFSSGFKLISMKINLQGQKDLAGLESSRKICEILQVFSRTTSASKKYSGRKLTNLRQHSKDSKKGL